MTEGMSEKTPIQTAIDALREGAEMGCVWAYAMDPVDRRWFEAVLCAAQIVADICGEKLPEWWPQGPDATWSENAGWGMASDAIRQVVKERMGQLAALAEAKKRGLR